MKVFHRLKIFYYLFLFCSVAILPSDAIAETNYAVVDIEALFPELQESEYSIAYAINDSGQIVIYSSHSYLYSRGFIWNPNDGIEDLGDLGADEVRPIDINNNGQVVGYAKTAFGIQQPFMWDSIYGMKDLGSIDRPTNASGANSINDYGEVVGFSSTRYGTRHPFIWDHVNGIRDLGTFSNPDLHVPFGGQAMGINNFGEVVGFYDNNPGSRLFFWDKENGFHKIGTLGRDKAIGRDINDSGDVVGYYCYNTDNVCNAFLWNKENGKINLDTGYTRSWAKAINEYGEIVGRAQYTRWSDSSYACLWSNGTYVDLNSFLPVDSGWFLKEATGINNKGQIVGYGWHNNKKKAFLLYPVQETIDVKIKFRSRELKSKGIKAFIQFPENYDLSGVLVDTISIKKLNGDEITPPIYANHIQTRSKSNRHLSIIAQFSSEKIIPRLRPGINKIIISGDSLTGNPFRGSSNIRFRTRNRRKNKTKELSLRRPQ